MFRVIANFLFAKLCCLCVCILFPFLYFTYQKREKTPMLGKIEGRRRRGRQRMRCVDGITISWWWTWVWANSRRWWRTGKPGALQSMGSQNVRHDWATEQNNKPRYLNPELPLPVLLEPLCSPNTYQISGLGLGTQRWAKLRHPLLSSSLQSSDKNDIHFNKSYSYEWW